MVTPGRWNQTGRWLRILRAVLLISPLLALPAFSQAAEDPFSPLKARLLQDGFRQREVTAAFKSVTTPQFKTVAKTFQIRESQLNYAQFLEPRSLDKARRFLSDHPTSLARAERTYGVDRHVIVAILLVETQFGSYTGKTPTLPILATFAVMDQKRNRDRIWTLLSPTEKAKWGREAFDEKLEARSRWAYGEVSALLTWARDNPVRIDTLQGSVMGAVGWPQFLPSSLVRFGTDGNQDGLIDLQHPDDAISSIANYLRGNGWKPALTRADKEGVIYTYNKSKPYVRTVLDAAELMERP